jgi:hypothetical protein
VSSGRGAEKGKEESFGFLGRSAARVRIDFGTGITLDSENAARGNRDNSGWLFDITTRWSDAAGSGVAVATVRTIAGGLGVGRAAGPDRPAPNEPKSGAAARPDAPNKAKMQVMCN